MATSPPSFGQTMEWSDLAVVLAIGRSGSLAGAARALGQNHSTVFRRINAIEDRTGVRFFDRFPSGYVPTEAGRTALSYAERIESEFHALGREVLGQDTALSGRIRLTCPEAMAEDLMPQVIALFREDHPEIFVDVSPGTAAADLSKREAEVAVRATRKPPDTSFGRKICDFRFALFASPGYLDRSKDMPLTERDWCAIDGTIGWLSPLIFRSPEAAERRTVFQCRASRAVQNACAENLGMALLPVYIGDADARLARASRTVGTYDLDLWVLTHPDLRGTARVRAMMAHLATALGAQSALFSGDLKSCAEDLLGKAEAAN